MINIAILGFGTVGSGVAEVIDINREEIKAALGEELCVKKILDLRDFPGNPYESLLTHDCEEVFNDSDISVVVETIGGARIAYDFTVKALTSGKSVVTSNKELVATHGVELMRLAKENNCSYLFEASVGGGIPIIRPLNRCLRGNSIKSIKGIVNGTTNYILTNMKDNGLSYDVALKMAQENGYAELNPSADIDGIDAQRKLSILSTIALGGKYVSPEEINAEGISKISLDDMNFASKIDCSLKLLAVFGKNDDSSYAYVAPHMVDKKNLLSSVDDVFNAISVEGNALGDSLYYGQGAGKLPTASAIVGDVIEVAFNPTSNYNSSWFEAEGRVTESYENIEVDIVVVAPSSGRDALKQQFESYKIASEFDLGDNVALIINSIAHKDIDSRLATINGAKFYHYMK